MKVSEMVDIKKFREKNTKEIEVMGDKWRIRKLSVMAMAEILQHFKSLSDFQEKLEREPYRWMPVVIPIILKRCVVEPKFKDVGDENYLGVDEIDTETGAFVVYEVFKFTGIVEAEETGNKFRGDTVHDIGSKSGGSTWNSSS